MAHLREVSTPDALASLNARVTDKRAREALNRRLTQLEQQRDEFARTLVCVERAIRWLPERGRASARRRLRDLGHDEQLDPFADLRATLEDAA